MVSFTTASFRARGLAIGFFLAPAAGLDGIRKRKLKKEGRLVKTDDAPMPDFIPIPHRLSYEKLAPGSLAPSLSNKKAFEELPWPSPSVNGGVVDSGVEDGWKDQVELAKAMAKNMQ